MIIRTLAIQQTHIAFIEHVAALQQLTVLQDIYNYVTAAELHLLSLFGREVMFVFKTLFFLFCLDISWATGTNYPPGVPPKRDNAGNLVTDGFPLETADSSFFQSSLDGGIQFHEPGEFKQQQQKMVRGRHNHHGAKINFQGQDSKEARE